MSEEKYSFDLLEHLNPNSKAATKNEKIIYLTTDDVLPNPQNFYDVTEIDDLAGMIAQQGGIKQPGIVKKLPDGRFMLIDGHRRRRALIKAMQDNPDLKNTFPVICRDFTPDEEIVALIYANMGQRVRSIEEKAQEVEMLRPIIEKLYKEGKATGKISGSKRAFFAKFLQISETELQRRSNYNNLIPDIKEAVAAGEVTSTAATEIAALPPDKQEKVYEKAREDDDLSVQGLKNAKKSLTNLSEINNIKDLQETVYPTADSDEPDEAVTEKGSFEQQLEAEGQTRLPETTVNPWGENNPAIIDSIYIVVQRVETRLKLLREMKQASLLEDDVAKAQINYLEYLKSVINHDIEEITGNEKTLNDVINEKRSS